MTMPPVWAWDGKAINRNGLYSDVPMAAYHSGRLCERPSLSSSGLRKIVLKSESHFFDSWPLNPDHYCPTPNEGMILGRAAHHLLLGQPNFRKEFVIRPTECLDAKGVLGPWQGNKYGAKKWMEDQAAAGLTVLTPEQSEAIIGMAKRLGREPLVMKGALNGLCEITMAWLDPDTGVWCLSRPDVIPTASGDFVDVKTLGRGTVSHSTLMHVIAEHGYHMQAALCREGWRIISGGQEMTSFSLYFVESTRPYCARMVQVMDRALDLGERQNRMGRQRFVRALNTGSWPGPGGLQEMVGQIDLADKVKQVMEQDLARNGVI